MKFQRPRGTHDIQGLEAKTFEAVERVSRAVFSLFGFEEFRTPFLEEKSLFTHALGTETDIVQKEMYEFTREGSEKTVALRPEGTAGIVRAYIEGNFAKTQGMAKFFYIGPMFRAERPQAGRLRQFHQIGVEAIGTPSPYADAEAILCLARLLEAMGVSGWKLKLNNLGTFEERKGFKEALGQYFKPLESKLCDDCKRRLDKNVFRLLDCKVQACRTVIEKSPQITGYLSDASKDHFEKVQSALKTSGIDFVLDPYMVRGLDYYTKTVFELTHPKLGAQDALAAGGRYDGLVESLGGDPAGAVGFAMGVERLLMCLPPIEAPVAKFEPYFYVVTLGDKAFDVGFKLVSDLRKKNLVAIMELEKKSMKSQMRSAGEKGTHALIIGDNEIEKNVVVLKDLKTGEQKEVNLKQFFEIFEKK